MAENSFRSRLLAKDKKGCHEYLKNHLGGKKLVLAIHDLLFLSIYVNAENVSVHPVCLVNSIKNFISDDKANPSIKLLLFIIDYLFQFENRKNDQKILDDAPPLISGTFGTGKITKEDTKEAFDQGYPKYFKSDTLEGLAEAAGINKGNFISTVSEYNFAQKTGKDKLGRNSIKYGN